MSKEKHPQKPEEHSKGDEPKGEAALAKDGHELAPKHGEPDDKAENTTGEEATPEMRSAKSSPFKRAWVWCLTHKKFSIPAAVVVLLAVLAAVPFTRFAIAGLFLKQDFSVQIVDSETGKPVSSVTVALQGQTAETDGEGNATLKTSVGYGALTAEKKYYESSSQKVTVPIAKQKTATVVELRAIGRAVPITVLNKISRKPQANITISGEETEAVTDAEGKATLVVPADKTEVAMTLKGDGFNETTGTVTVTTDEVPANTFEVTPSGKVYFLSNASGKIDLVKTNLDGSDRQTVLAGTGKEDRSDTSMTASTDWKYIALRSKRDGGEYAKLFLIETDTGKVTTMDEGEAEFRMYGWSGDRVIYLVDRDNKRSWETGRQALKSYHAPTKKLTTLMQTEAKGDQNRYGYEYTDNVFLIGDEVVFNKNWSISCYYYYYSNDCDWLRSDSKGTINTIRIDGSQKKVIKRYDDDYVSTKREGFDGVLVLYNEGDKEKVDAYRNGRIETAKMTRDEYSNNSRPFVMKSPDKSKTFWSENRDGKNIFFIGDGNGENGKEIGRSDEFTVDGWYNDQYLLLTKKGSEMYIMSVDGDLGTARKVTDFYQPYGHEYYY